MRIAIGNDHAATDMKLEIMEYLRGQGHEVINVGTDGYDSVDYPIYAKKVCDQVNSGEAERGIAICGTGVGISIACNKVDGIRAVCCSEPFSAKLSRQHNDTNVLCFGARVVGPELAKMIVDEWMQAKFLGGRHQRRIDEIRELEK